MPCIGTISDIGTRQEVKLLAQNGLRTLLIVMPVFGLATLVLWIVLGKTPSTSRVYAL